jgi:two-component system alkaline phosphatase synthesis response regulator PhoP/two-component system response regulator VicR
MSEKQRILIVDDSHALVLAAKLVLEKNGFDVLIAYDGKEGLEKAQKEKPDLIILDINMPKMNGYEVCQSLKKNPDTVGISVIILSTKGEVDEKKNAPIVGLKEVFEGYKLGANNFLTKPVTAEELLDAVKKELLFSNLLKE